MEQDRHQLAATDMCMDRQIIRVDVPSAHAGIAAALRRAFMPESHESREEDFTDLLQRLN